MRPTRSAFYGTDFFSARLAKLPTVGRRTKSAADGARLRVLAEAPRAF